jgi:hypothetical protein
MSCDGSHLGFPIGIKNRNLVKDIPMIIYLQFGFSQFITFREDLWNFSQSEHIIGPGSHLEYPTGTKNSNFVEDHPRNIPAKFGSNWPSGFGEEAWNVKSLQTKNVPSKWTEADIDHRCSNNVYCWRYTTIVYIVDSPNFRQFVGNWILNKMLRIPPLVHLCQICIYLNTHYQKMDYKLIWNIELCTNHYESVQIISRTVNRK